MGSTLSAEVATVAEAGLTFVSSVRVEVADPPIEGVTLLEENVHFEFLGRPLQAKVAAAPNPLTELTVTVVVALLPAFTETLVGERATAKSGGPGHTVTATGLEAEAEFRISPP